MDNIEVVQRLGKLKEELLKKNDGLLNRDITALNKAIKVINNNKVVNKNRNIQPIFISAYICGMVVSVIGILVTLAILK